MFKADSILLNGKVITVEGQGEPDLYFVAVKGDEILHIGRKGEEKEFASPHTEIFDVKGGTILPGFIDAHLHLSVMAEMAMQLDVSPEVVSSFEEIKQMVKEEGHKIPEGQWIRAAGYDDTKLEGKPLTRRDLDEVALRHPVFITHVTTHWGVTNSLGLSMGGLHESTEDPPGGSLGRDPASHQLNGILYENAAFPYYFEALSPGEVIIPPFSRQELYRGVLKVCEKYLKAGITSIHDALTTPRFFEIYQDLRNMKKLPLRVYGLVPCKFFPLFRDCGLRTRFGDKWLSLGAIKFITDGAIAGRTAYLKEPYEVTELGSGILLLNEGETREMILEYHEAGFQIAVHANGDRAIEIVLDGFEAALRKFPRENQRHRIEHCSLVTDEILTRMKAMNLIAVPFASYVWHHGEKILPFYGEARAERIFPHKSFLNAGIRVAGSTDNPCAPYDPLLGIQSCVTRRSKDGTLLGEIQKLTLMEALKIYTLGSAYASFEEDRKGSLKPGKLADMVVLKEDITKVSPDEIKDISISLTMVGGDVKYHA
ncbi:MAG: amidohydrolase [Thermodesulfobacteriota bacterium]